MAHTVDHLFSAHPLRSVYGQQKGQARNKDPVGSNLTGYQGQSATGQACVQALWRCAPLLSSRHEVLLPGKAFLCS